MIKTLIILTVFINELQSSADNKFQIHKNELSADMQTFVFSTVLQAVNEFGACSYSRIADKVVEQMNDKYANNWYCFAGKNLVEPSFNSGPNTFMWLSYEDTQIMLFRAPGLTEPDMIADARLKTGVTLFESEMTDCMQTYVLELTSQVLCKHNDFESIALNMSNTLDHKYGNYWRVSVGQPVNDDDNVYAPKTYISYKVADIQFVAYQSNQPQTRLTCEHVLSRARAECDARVSHSDDIDDKLQNSIIDWAKTAINSDYKSCAGNCYEAIGNALKESLNANSGCDSGGQWSVVAGLKHFYGSQFNAHKSIKFNFGPLHFTAAKF